MKLLFKIFILAFALLSFTSANAVTIKWLHLNEASSSNMPGILKAVAEYEAKTGNKVELQYLENESFKAKLPTMLQSDDRPDIFYSWSGGVMYDQAKAGFLRDISGVVSDDYLSTLSAAAANAFTFEEQRVGIPTHVAQVAWWYNKELVNQAGVDVSKIVY